MAQRFGFDILGDIIKLDSFTILLKSSIIQIESKSYNTSDLNLDIRSLGLGGLDLGTIESSTSYNLFLVVSESQPYLIASKNQTPSGYSMFKLIARFKTDLDFSIKFILKDYLQNIDNLQFSRITLNNNYSYSLRPFLNFNLNSNITSTSTLSQTNYFDWSYDDKFMVSSQTTTPFILIYEKNDNYFTQLANPSTLPTGSGNGCKFSKDARFLAVAHETTPFITIYERNNLTFTKLANPSFLPTNTAFSCDWSPDSRFLAVGQLLTPFVNIYERIGSNFVKLPNPPILPAGNGREVSFSPNGRFLAVAHLSFPNLTIYEIIGNSFVKLPDPVSLPTSNSFTLSWSPSGNYLAVAGNVTLVVYKVVGNTFNRIYSISPGDNCRRVFWSKDEKYLGLVLFGFPSIRFYILDNDIITPASDIPNLNLFEIYGASFSNDNRFLALGSTFSPFIRMYDTSAEKPNLTNKNLKIVMRK
jgi:hypothetical protein